MALLWLACSCRNGRFEFQRTCRRGEAMPQFRRLLRIAIALGCAAFLGAVALAQINTVQISGTVSDQQGLGVPKAQVTVTNAATGATRSATSDSSGRYEIVGLPPGTYSLTVEAQGFAKLVNPAITLTIGAPAVFNPVSRSKKLRPSTGARGRRSCGASSSPSSGPASPPSPSSSSCSSGTTTSSEPSSPRLKT